MKQGNGFWKMGKIMIKNNPCKSRGSTWQIFPKSLLIVFHQKIFLQNRSSFNFFTSA
jgi:hypothetical protein